MRVSPIKYALTAILLLALLTVWGCASRSSGDPNADTDDRTIFRHRWWNYYARGLSAAEGRAYSRAIADLQTALQKRDRDQRMARTYGMHFVDYFPHRELGILFWETHRLADAQAQLETSIAQAPTAKALYYLDRVREARIRRRMQQDTAPTPPPDIRLDAPKEGIHTRDDPVVIRGTVSDSNYVTDLTVDGQAIFLAGARQRVDFRQPFELSHGYHLIKIRASSLSGLSRQQTITVHIDRQGPVIDVQTVERAVNGTDKHWILIGRVIDPSGVASLIVNQSPVSIPSETTVSFSIPMNHSITTVSVSATDRLGNATHTRFDLKDVTAIGRPPSSILLASSEPLILTGRLFQKSDRQAPTIRLKGWTASQKVYMDKVVIEGSVRDNHQIASISINDQPVTETPLAGVLAAFSSSIALDEGENVITIAATDAAGNRTVEQIAITRQTPKARLLNERLSVGILPFAQRGQITATSDAFQDVFMQQLALRNRFKLVDRTLLDIILQEHKINRTDLIAPETALRTGRLAAANAFISGSIIQTRMGMEAISRLVDTETAEVLTTVDAFIEAKTLPVIKEAAEQLALKLHREFQMVDGDILDRQKQYIVTDLGSEQLRAQRRILVIQEQPVFHPVTHHPLGSDYRVLGRARLVHIQKDFSKGELHEGSDPAISPSHGVITQ